MNEVYILEYDGVSFHKNYMDPETGQYDYEPSSNGYEPLCKVHQGTDLETLLGFMTRAFSGRYPSIEEVKRCVSLVKMTADLCDAMMSVNQIRSTD